MYKQLPIGINDFKILRKTQSYYIDKSNFISCVLDLPQIIFITRPSGFGKTLNLTMLKYFFTIANREKNKTLFCDLEISQNANAIKHQGNYPTIHIDFKNMYYTDYLEFVIGFRNMLKNIYIQYNYLEKSDILNDFDKKMYRKFVYETIDNNEMENSIKILINLLSRHHNKKCILLIDEYDAPLKNDLKENIKDEIQDFMKKVLVAALDNNSDLKKGIIMGKFNDTAQEVCKEIGSIKLCSIFNKELNDKFGFTEKEVESLVKIQNKSKEIKDIKEWYGKYNFSGELMYNSFSVLKCLGELEQGLRPYIMFNNEGNILLNEIFKYGIDMEGLVNENSIYEDNSIDIITYDFGIFNKLLETGYISYEIKESNKMFNCRLSITNKECYYNFMSIFDSWLERSSIANNYITIMNSLLKNDIDRFQNNLEIFLKSAMKYFETSKNKLRQVYSIFILCILNFIKNKSYLKLEVIILGEECSLILKEDSGSKTYMEIKFISKESGLPYVSLKYQGTKFLIDFNYEEY